MVSCSAMWHSFMFSRDLSFTKLSSVLYLFLEFWDTNCNWWLFYMSQIQILMISFSLSLCSAFSVYITPLRMLTNILFPGQCLSSKLCYLGDHDPMFKLECFPIYCLLLYFKSSLRSVQYGFVNRLGFY